MVPKGLKRTIYSGGEQNVPFLGGKSELTILTDRYRAPIVMESWFWWRQISRSIPTKNTISMNFYSLARYDVKICSTDSHNQHTNGHSQSITCYVLTMRIYTAIYITFSNVKVIPVFFHRWARNSPKKPKSMKFLGEISLKSDIDFRLNRFSDR